MGAEGVLLPQLNDAMPEYRPFGFFARFTEVQKDVLRIGGGVLLVGGLAALGWFVGVPQWHRWQGRKAAGEAEVFARKRDYQGLVVALRRATEQAPLDPAVWRSAVRILEEIGSPDALFARQQLARLAPEDASLKLAEAQEALRFGRIDSAQSVLGGLERAGRSDAAFHRLAAAAALAMGHSAEMQQHLAALIAADPKDLDARFNYAAARLWSEDPAAAGDGRVRLQELLAEPSVRVRAAVQLVSEAAARRDAPRLQRTIQSLLAVFAPSARPDFSGAEPPAWTALLGGLQSAAAPAPADAALVARWFSDVGRRRDAIDWLDRLPAPVRDAPAVLDANAQLNAEEGNLGRFEVLLRRGAWGVVPFDAVTLAVASRLQAVRFDAVRGHATWADAIASCGGSEAGLRCLARMASAWRDSVESDQAAEAVIKRNPAAFWAYDALRNSYASRGDLRQLWRLYGLWTAQLPEDAELAAQWIKLGCILDSATAELHARARALHERGPRTPAVETAYAASLWRQGHPDRAWAVLEALPPAVLAQPGTSFWATLVLADLGRNSDANAALARTGALKAQFGAEETDLLNRAADKVAYRPSGGL